MTEYFLVIWVIITILKGIEKKTAINYIKDNKVTIYCKMARANASGPKDIFSNNVEIVLELKVIIYNF